MIAISDLLSRPRYGGSWCATGTHWASDDLTALAMLCDAKADLTKSADALGRSPSSIAHRARDMGFRLPSEWGALVVPKRKPTPTRIHLAYPYIIRKRDEHADLLAVNALVPHGIPGREDICQEIMLALWEGTISLDQLKANRSNVRAFVRSFAHDNYEAGGYAMSLDQPMFDGRSWHDVLPAPRYQ